MATGVVPDAVEAVAGCPAATAVLSSLDGAGVAAPELVVPGLVVPGLVDPVVLVPGVAPGLLLPAPDGPAVEDPGATRLEPGVPAEPALDVREGVEPGCAAAGLDGPEDPCPDVFAGVDGLGLVVGRAADVELAVGFGDGFAVGFAVGLVLPPELMAGGLTPGWAPAPKLNPTAVPGAGE
ncbi:hypothetical protein [Branchiibius sp. NY16-3462-2]|uniref:hypothetical protein n=1 Tax=Branchiibius sp. NY16-3462-2 TaxID=1807500 RepID=UPI0007934E0A|nr:hypothetical protein [Branchiibius sp. NY16-3462-2]KYH44011.1 hypothetical protein AZH51_04505 [Branchiibius sp. NY16-3462-2]